LGQYPGEYDIVEDVYVANISMHNASAGARIKVWPNTASALSGDLQGKLCSLFQPWLRHMKLMGILYKRRRWRRPREQHNLRK
jgi:hypothetical protein